VHHVVPGARQIAAIVAPAAQRQYATVAEAIGQHAQLARRTRMAGTRQRRCVIGSPADAVGATLQDEELTGAKRSTCASMLRPYRIELLIAGARRQRHVELGPHGRAASDLIIGAGARVECLAALVQIGKNQVWIVLESVVHAIAVMRIDIDIGDALDMLCARRRCSTTTPQSLNTQKPAARSRAA
jgi:hypothetical protein